MSNPQRPLTGEQYELRTEAGGHVWTATITELAAGIRMLRADGVDLVEHYGADVIAPGAAGIVLVPWPNRIRDARWQLDGKVQQLDVTDPKTGGASHGLLRNTGYSVRARSDDAVTLAAGIFPQHGYPFALDTEVTHALGADGMTVTHVVRNVGPQRAPVAIGAHPYLRVGDVPIDDLVVRVAAATVFDLDDKQIPIGTQPVSGDTDLRAGRRVGELQLDTGYTDVAHEAGRTVQTLTAPDGARTSLWGDASIRALQVFTNDAWPDGAGGLRRALAIEPMTAPADAFNSGRDLRWLEPDESWTVTWGISYTAASV
jgi:aldose 1-epimerase